MPTNKLSIFSFIYFLHWIRWYLMPRPRTSSLNKLKTFYGWYSQFVWRDRSSKKKKNYLEYIKTSGKRVAHVSITKNIEDSSIKLLFVKGGSIYLIWKTTLGAIIKKKKEIYFSYLLFSHNFQINFYNIENISKGC